jgi:hypothetical protein
MGYDFGKSISRYNNRTKKPNHRENDLAFDE